MFMEEKVPESRLSMLSFCDTYLSVLARREQMKCMKRLVDYTSPRSLDQLSAENEPISLNSNIACSVLMEEIA